MLAYDTWLDLEEGGLVPVELLARIKNNLMYIYNTEITDKDLSAVKAQIVDIETDIYNLQTLTRAQQATLDDITPQITDFAKKITDNTSKIAAVVKQVGDMQTTYDKKIKDLTDIVNNINLDTTDIETKINGLQDSIKTLQGEIDAISLGSVTDVTVTGWGLEQAPESGKLSDIIKTFWIIDYPEDGGTK